MVESMYFERERERIVIVFSCQYSVAWYNAWADHECIISTWSPCSYNYEEIEWKYWYNLVNEDSESLDEEDEEIERRLLNKKRQNSSGMEEEAIQLDISDTEDPIPPVIYLFCTIFR